MHKSYSISELDWNSTLTLLRRLMLRLLRNCGKRLLQDQSTNCPG